jgi:hypothetical protein
VVVQQLFPAPNYIDVKILENDGRECRLTGMYGEPRGQDKYKTCDKLRELNGQYDLPWVLIGDLNKIMFSHKKDGGNPRPQRYKQAFRDALTDCNLDDPGFIGDRYTWKCGRICERLDHAIANNTWSNLFPGAVLQHLDYCKSDHRAILLYTDFQSSLGQSKKGPKRFEARWLQSGILKISSNELGRKQERLRPVTVSLIS